MENNMTQYEITKKGVNKICYIHGGYEYETKQGNISGEAQMIYDENGNNIRAIIDIFQPEGFGKLNGELNKIYKKGGLAHKLLAQIIEDSKTKNAKQISFNYRIDTLPNHQRELLEQYGFQIKGNEIIKNLQ